MTKQPIVDDSVIECTMSNDDLQINLKIADDDFSKIQGNLQNPLREYTPINYNFADVKQRLEHLFLQKNQIVDYLDKSKYRSAQAIPISQWARVCALINLSSHLEMRQKKKNLINEIKEKIPDVVEFPRMSRKYIDSLIKKYLIEYNEKMLGEIIGHMRVRQNVRKLFAICLDQIPIVAQKISNKYEREFAKNNISINERDNISAIEQNIIFRQKVNKLIKLFDDNSNQDDQSDDQSDLIELFKNNMIDFMQILENIKKLCDPICDIQIDTQFDVQIATESAEQIATESAEQIATESTEQNDVIDFTPYKKAKKSKTSESIIMEPKIIEDFVGFRKEYDKLVNIFTTLECQSLRIDPSTLSHKVMDIFSPQLRLHLFQMEKLHREGWSIISPYHLDMPRGNGRCACGEKGQLYGISVFGEEKFMCLKCCDKEEGRTNPYNPNIVIQVVRRCFYSHYMERKKMFLLMDMDSSFVTSCLMCLYH